MTALKLIHITGNLTFLLYFFIGFCVLCFGAGTEKGSAFLGGYILGSLLLAVAAYLTYGVTV